MMQVNWDSESNHLQIANPYAISFTRIHIGSFTKIWMFSCLGIHGSLLKRMFATRMQVGCTIESQVLSYDVHGASSYKSYLCGNALDTLIHSLPQDTVQRRVYSDAVSSVITFIFLSYNPQIPSFYPMQYSYLFTIFNAIRTAKPYCFIVIIFFHCYYYEILIENVFFFLWIIFWKFLPKGSWQPFFIVFFYTFMIF